MDYQICNENNQNDIMIQMNSPKNRNSPKTLIIPTKGTSKNSNSRNHHINKANINNT